MTNLPFHARTFLRCTIQTVRWKFQIALWGLTAFKIPLIQSSVKRFIFPRCKLKLKLLYLFFVVVVVCFFKSANREGIPKVAHDRECNILSSQSHKISPNLDVLGKNKYTCRSKIFNLFMDVLHLGVTPRQSVYNDGPNVTHTPTPSQRV